MGQRAVLTRVWPELRALDFAERWYQPWVRGKWPTGPYGLFQGVVRKKGGRPADEDGMEVLFAELVSDGFARLFTYGWFFISMAAWNGRFVMDWPLRAKGPGETEPFRVRLVVDRT